MISVTNFVILSRQCDLYSRLLNGSFYLFIFVYRYSELVPEVIVLVHYLWEIGPPVLGILEFRLERDTDLVSKFRSKVVSGQTPISSV